MQHASHSEIIKRLKQAHGQLASILSMFDTGGPALISRSSFKPWKA
jgi:DNA-binding FrmR family transcriptional regulator